MSLENTALVTHRGCMDGSTCALVFLAGGGKRENIYFSSPSHEDTDEIVNYLAETWGGPILVADASISLELAEKLNSRGVDIEVVDHHKSAIPLNKFDWCDIDVENTRAGGRMLWDWMSDNNYFNAKCEDLRDLVMAADDYDRWIKELPISEELMGLHGTIGQELFIDRFSKNPEVVFTPEEEYLLNVERFKRDEYIERKKNDAFYRFVEVDGKEIKVAIVEAGNHQSLLGNQLCSDPKCGADVAVLVNGRSISLRASATCPVDLSKIAKRHGGGGHHKAAGVGVDKLLETNFVEMVFDRIRWNDS